MDAYEWISHRGYFSNAKKWNWLHTDFVLSMLSEHKSKQRRCYQYFVAQEDGTEISFVFEKRKLLAILGSDGLIDRILSQFFGKQHIEVHESKILAPGKVEIKELVCRIYGVNDENLLKPRMGTYNEPRIVAIYLAEIYGEYGLKIHSSANSAVEKVRGLMNKDQRFKKRVDKLARLLAKHHTET